MARDPEPTAKKRRIDASNGTNGAVATGNGDYSDDSSDDESHFSAPTPAPSNSSLYLETINRKLLDFDFDKLCLVTLSTVNVYCCLVCGRYFLGRSVSSPAYLHSLNNDHHVFLHLDTKTFFVLPEDYQLGPEILASLQDIVAYLDPQFTRETVRHIPKTGLDLNREPYDVGYVGLNRVLSPANVVLQALLHILPVRDFYLQLSYKTQLDEILWRKSPLNAKLGLLTRRLWSPHLFRTHVSPHELLQLVPATCTTPKKFLVWFVNQLHSQLAKSIKKSPFKALQGAVKITTIPLVERETNNKVEFIQSDTTTAQTVKFWMLTVDLPSSPIFSEDTKIQEVLLTDLLAKYDGKTTTQTTTSELKTFRIQTLPQFLLLHIDRGLETEAKGNTAVVKFPQELDMAPYSDDKSPLKYKLHSLIKHQLVDREELHEWSINLKQGDSWITVNDLEIKQCQSELMFLDESYIQVWEKTV